MAHQRIDFQSLPWESPAPGIRFKAHVVEGKKIRLLEFTDQLFERDWCLKEHFGYVLEGRLTIDFQGNIVEYEAGDGLVISEGEHHKAHVARGERALMIMFEKP
jgi:ethanolamine utilization protein EutQ (cupin superfamily)